MNLCSDDQLNLESCVIHAMNAIGFLRFFDCNVNLLCISTPLAKTIVLYRCQMTDYTLKMVLAGCAFPSGNEKFNHRLNRYRALVENRDSIEQIPSDVQVEVAYIKL
jgi:hypothetical protein